MTLVAVAGGKGSPGSTFVAMNLAAAMASRGVETLLLDLDTFGGDLAAFLGLNPRSGLYPLMRLEGKSPSFEAVIREAQSRDGVLCVGGFPTAEEADLEMVAWVLQEASEAPEKTVIADLGRVAPTTAHLFLAADAILLAVRPDVVGVYAAQRGIHTLTEAGSNPTRIYAVVNGWRWRRSADLAETVDSLKVKVIGSIALDERESRRAVHDQRFLRGGSAFKAFRSLADEVSALTGSAKKVAALT